MQLKVRRFIYDLKVLVRDAYLSKKAYLMLFIGILVGLICGALLVNGFYEIFDELQDGELALFDDKYTQSIQGLRSPPLTDAMFAVSWMGDRNAYIIFSVLLFFFFYLRYRSLVFPLQTTLVLLVAGGLNKWLKVYISRPRPTENHLVEVASMSFPSGHAMSSIVFFGFLIYLVWRLIISSWVRWLLSLVLIAIILSIGFSRVYLGVHYPSDVLAGYAAGGACLAVFISCFTFIRYTYIKRGLGQGKEKEE